jgi:hypothetical protein
VQGDGRRSGPGTGGTLSRPARQAFRAVWSHLVVEDPATECDALFCFGSRHHRVPEVAGALHRRGIAPLVLVTGGPAGPGEPAEADLFAARLEEAGVPARAIVRERSARHTGENVALGLAALRRRAPVVRRLALVSWPLAARRCRATSALHAPDVDLVTVPALPGPGLRWTPTMRRARLALGEVDRLDRYGAFGLIVAQPAPASVRRGAATLRSELGGRRSAHDSLRLPVEAAWPVGEAQDAALLLGEG